MEAFFEDSKSPELSKDQTHPFYSFINGTMHNDGPILPHWHYYLEMLYVLKGEGKLINNGHVITLHQGDFAFLLPRDVHAIIYVDNKTFEYIVVKYDPDMLFDDPYQSLYLKNILPVIQPILPQLKVINVNREGCRMDTCMKDIYQAFSSQYYGFEFVVKSNILNSFYYIINHLKNNNITLNLNKNNKEVLSSIIPAYEYIHHHYNEELSARALAEYCHLSYSYFSRLFKKVSGISFTHYLNFVRINESEKLLLENKCSITEIAFQVGFSDTSYFIKKFKAYKKVTPKQFIMHLYDVKE